MISCLTEWNFIQLHVSEWVTVERFTVYVSYLGCQSPQKIGHKCKREMGNQYYLWREEARGEAHIQLYIHIVVHLIVTNTTSYYLSL